MNFKTYPVNPLNPGSIIPVIFGRLWARLANGNLEVAVDTYKTAKKVEGLDIRTFHYDGAIPNFTEPNISLDITKLRVEVEEYTGEWRICECAKVEIFDINDFEGYKTNMMVDGKCILCQTKVEMKKSTGLVARVDKLTDPEVSELESLYPGGIENEIIYWINILRKKPLLISRQRTTHYPINFGAERKLYHLDPTIFNIASTWYTAGDAWLVCSRADAITYGLGRLLMPVAPKHVFIPKIKVSDWVEFTETSEEKILINLVYAVNLNKNHSDYKNIELTSQKFKKMQEKINSIKLDTISDIRKIRSILI